jgi:hypothetical protein
LFPRAASREKEFELPGWMVDNQTDLEEPLVSPR